MEKDVQRYKEVAESFPGDYYDKIDEVFANETYHEKNMPLPTENVYDIRDFGASKDPAYLSTDAINSAIVAASKTQGTVIINGIYRAGTIYMQDDVTLFVTEDSRLLGSRDPEKYDGAFIVADKKKNVTFTGGGRICGEGEYFVGLPNISLRDRYPKIEANFERPILMKDGIPDYINVSDLKRISRKRIRGLKMEWKRQKLVRIYKCLNVNFYNFVLQASAEWTLNIEESSNVNIEKLIINDNRHVANADGIDINGSNNVTVKDSFISAADDAIVLKNSSGHPMGNVCVANSVMQSVANCFKIGTETSSDIGNVTVTKCRLELPDIYPGACSGIAIESADGAHVSYVALRDITMYNVQCPIFISVNNRMRFGTEKPDWSGVVKNILIENVKAEHVEVPSIITGASDAIERNSDSDVSAGGIETVQKAEHYVYCENVTLTNIDISYRESTENLSRHMACENTEDGNATIDEMSGMKLYPTAREYPEHNRLGDVPAYGFYVRHARNIRFENVSVKKRTCDTRPEKMTVNVE